MTVTLLPKKATGLLPVTPTIPRLHGCLPQLRAGLEAYGFFPGTGTAFLGLRPILAAMGCKRKTPKSHESKFVCTPFSGVPYQVIRIYAVHYNARFLVTISHHSRQSPIKLNSGYCPACLALRSMAESSKERQVITSHWDSGKTSRLYQIHHLLPGRAHLADELVVLTQQEQEQALPREPQASVRRRTGTGIWNRKTRSNAPGSSA
ncbi:hypothetical protein ACJU26_02640 [Acidithiobacillus sp. M4-SHS-6]|uniref:hypothetical protein n=1 Tax=Acidithiobacillus sp. M4-SHS-6 TaxID=3383024 RepID=UPI0039BEAE37